MVPCKKQEKALSFSLNKWIKSKCSSKHLLVMCKLHTEIVICLIVGFYCNIFKFMVLQMKIITVEFTVKSVF